MKFAIVTAALLSLVAWAELRGWALTEPSRRHPPVPASVRSSPGGYRSYHFWHTGYHGGK